MTIGGRSVARSVAVTVALFVGMAVPGVAFATEVAVLDGAADAASDAIGSLAETVDTVGDSTVVTDAVVEEAGAHVDAVADQAAAASASVTETVTESIDSPASEVTGTAEGSQPASAVSDSGLVSTEASANGNRTGGDEQTGTASGSTLVTDGAAEHRAPALGEASAIGRATHVVHADVAGSRSVARRSVLAEVDEPTQAELDDLLEIGDAVAGASVLSERLTAPESSTDGARLALTGVSLLVLISIGLLMISTGSATVRVRPT